MPATRNSKIAKDHNTLTKSCRSTMLPVKEKKFDCHTCGKTFKRRDVLSRHQKCHEAASAKYTGPIVSHRACARCASARTKCSKTQPCQRCDEKKLRCDFPSAVQQQTPSADVAPHPVDDAILSPTTPVLSYETPGTILQPIPSSDGFHDAEGAVGPPTCPVSSCEVPKSLGAPVDCRNTDCVIVQATGIHQSEVAEVVLDSNVNGNPSLVPEPNTSELIPGTCLPDFSSNEILSGSTINWMPLSDYHNSYIDSYYQSLGGAFLPPEQHVWNPACMQEPVYLSGNFNAGDNFSTNIQPCHSASRGFTPGGSPGDTFAGYSPRSTLSRSTKSDNSRTTLYADGKGARTATRRHLKRLKFYTQSGLQDEIGHHQYHTDFYLPSIKLDGPYIADREFETCVQIVDYQSILQKYHALCESPNFLYTRFQTGFFPSLEVCNLFVHVYFKNFDTIFPLLHKETFKRHKTSWLLKLAVIATGAIFVDTDQHDGLCEALQEFLRRSIQVEIEQESTTSLARYQAYILNIIGMSQCARPLLRKKAKTDSVGIVTLCQQIAQSQDWQVQMNEYNSAELHHSKWIAYQEWTRLVFTAWILSNIIRDDIVANIVQWAQLGELHLPAHESLWRMPIIELQQHDNLDGNRNATLFQAMQALYVTKETDSSLDDFSQTILVYAICSKTQEIGFRSQERLSRWMPTPIRTRSEIEDLEPKSIWLPSDPTYASWRNGACDCLDIIHWQANSLSARNAGMESPLILHLHLVRLVLLTPVQQMFTLAENMISAPAEADLLYQKQVQLADEIVKKWLVLDQCKARLAVVHAGAIIWSVRHFATGSFVEPQTIQIASLVLWFYGKYRDVLSHNRDQESAVRARQSPSEHIHAHSSVPRHTHENIGDNMDDDDASSCSDAVPEIIVIDRPCDDQLVQHFVRAGDSMTVILAHVGSLCAFEGPRRVLLEGARLLSRREGHWGIHMLYHDLLTRLAQVATSNMDQ